MEWKKKKRKKTDIADHWANPKDHPRKIPRPPNKPSLPRVPVERKRDRLPLARPGSSISFRHTHPCTQQEALNYRSQTLGSPKSQRRSSHSLGPGLSLKATISSDASCQAGHKMCLNLTFQWTQHQLGLPGSEGTLVLQAHRQCSRSCSCSWRERIFVGQDCHSWTSSLLNIFPRPKGSK